MQYPSHTRVLQVLSSRVGALLLLAACHRLPGSVVWSVPEAVPGAVLAGAGYPQPGVLFLHRDQQGNVSLVTDAAGQVVTDLHYRPHGDLAPSSSGEDVSRPKLAGRELDRDTGLYQQGARYYDPTLGRFITADTRVFGAADPLQAAALNSYTYGLGNPVMYSDPSGHDAIANADWPMTGLQGLLADQMDILRASIPGLRRVLEDLPEDLDASDLLASLMASGEVLDGPRENDFAEGANQKSLQTINRSLFQSQRPGFHRVMVLPNHPEYFPQSMRCPDYDCGTWVRGVLRHVAPSSITLTMHQAQDPSEFGQLITQGKAALLSSIATSSDYQDGDVLLIGINARMTIHAGLLFRVSDLLWVVHKDGTGPVYATDPARVWDYMPDQIKSVSIYRPPAPSAQPPLREDIRRWIKDRL